MNRSVLVALLAPQRTQRALAFVLATSIGAFWAPRMHAQSPARDSVSRRRLSVDTVIDGVPCASSARAPAEFHRNGRLAGCALAREFRVGAHDFPVTTWLDLRTDGALWGAWLARDTKLSGHLCRGDGYKKWSVRFHPNGALAECRLKYDTVVAGIPCMQGTFLRELRGGGRTALHLYANGSLRQCMVARDTVIEGRPVKKWQVVQRDSVTAMLR